MGGRSVENYTYGKEEASPTYTAYEVGDEVTYNNVDYYVITDSDSTESTVTLLKAEPLTVEEVNTYGGVGTDNNHVNEYVPKDTSFQYYQTAYDLNGYGGMAYYSRNNCYIYGGPYADSSGCVTDYDQSDIKYVVDAWKEAQAIQATEARLITYDELIDNLGYDHASWNASYWIINSEYTPSWVYNSNYSYWTMTSSNDLATYVWSIKSEGSLMSNSVSDYYRSNGVVRPVIVLPKSALN